MPILMFAEIETQEQYTVYVDHLDISTMLYISHLQSRVLFSNQVSFSLFLQHCLRLCYPRFRGALLPTGRGYLPQSLPLRLGGATATHALPSIASASWVGANGWEGKFDHFLR